jgi:hypothetical protein
MAEIVFFKANKAPLQRPGYRKFLKDNPSTARVWWLSAGAIMLGIVLLWLL